MWLNNIVGVYLSLDSVIIPNHGYVAISDIGSTDDTALICHTNRSPPNNGPNSGRHWFAPDETRVDFKGTAVPGFRRNRGAMIVRLLRNTSAGTPSEGIYHCLVDDDTNTLQIINVGLYNSEGGKWLFTACSVLWKHIENKLNACIF